MPEDPAEWTAWLDAKSYESWRCDPTAQPPLSDSPHGNNIICVNDALWGARDAEGAYPVGAAAVKLVIGNDGNVGTRYIDARLKADEGAAGWYFYVDGSGPRGFGDDEPVTFCADCHDNQGARDYVRRIPN